MKKIVYGALFCAVLGMMAFLLYYRIYSKKEAAPVTVAQTIIPEPVVVQSNTVQDTEDFVFNNGKTAAMLSSDEILIDEVSSDITRNGKKDYIAAVKKISDTHIYFVIFFESAAGSLVRAGEIKTTITQPAGLTFYLLSVPQSREPALVYTGMNAENVQLFTVKALQIKSNGTLATQLLAHIQADGQILLKKHNSTGDENVLDEYTVYAYQLNTAEQDTLTQIEQQYTWDEKKYTFIKTHERVIPGKKIQKNMLNRLQNSKTGSFKRFLTGLWYEPASKDTQHRSLFFNPENSELIFVYNNIQEIFTIHSTVHRRYGMSFFTKNVSIPSIRRRVNIELADIDEINVRVIENVDRLKIGAASNWDGVYRKVSSTIQSDDGDTGKTAYIKKRIQKKLWKSIDGSTLSFSDTEYELTRDDSTDKGRYVLLYIKDSVILEWKKDTGKTVFFVISVHASKDGNEKLILTESSIDVDTITKGNVQMIFE